MEKAIKERLGEGYEVKKVSVNKNNGLVLNGYCITPVGSKVGASIYVNDVPEDEIVDYVVERFKEAELPQFDTKFISKDFILANVYPTLVNSETNTEMLATLVHRKFIDLEIIYRVGVSETGSYRVERKLLEHVGITPAELHKHALSNMRERCLALNLGEVLHLKEEVPITILTYQDKIFGSGAMLNTSILKKLSKKYESDLYIIPASVDEVLVVPTIGSKEALNKMICTINKEEVSAENVLSDHVYIFKDGKVEVA